MRCNLKKSSKSSGQHRQVVWKKPVVAVNFHPGAMYAPVVDMVTDGPGTHNLILRSSVDQRRATVPAGKLMVYIGAVLQRQRDCDDKLVQFNAHTFMYAGGTYTVGDYKLLKQA